jgi:hypothetical protein
MNLTTVLGKVSVVQTWFVLGTRELSILFRSTTARVSAAPEAFWFASTAIASLEIGLL